MIVYMHTPGRSFFMNTIINNAILGKKIPLISSIITGFVVGLCLLGIIIPQTTNADFPGNTHCTLVVAKAGKAVQAAVRTIKVVITAYSSTHDQTDDTPLITASGKYVKDGIIANNMLPFGTKIRIPGLYGNKVFTVEDRMNKRKPDHQFDIWFPSKDLAVNFGVKTAYIEILEN